jgi:GH35 family endo-1,4-beta-xylanase
VSEIIRDAQRRIKQVRQKDVELIVKKDGKPVSNAGVSIRMKNHQFLFGAICYLYGKYKTQEMNDLFSEEFVKIFNYTMMPVHWGQSEPKPHQYNEPYTSNLIKWAKANNIKRKMHAIIWHEVCPEWVTFEDDITALYTERFTHLMRTYGDDFDFFDLANETTVNDRFDNPVSRWVKKSGPMNMLKFGTKLARSFKPDAKLIYGDWNVHVEEYYDFLRDMRENHIDIDIIGMQSHMHRELWSEEETIRVMDRAAEFGWPIHFPECSICSGKPIGETSYAPGGGKTNRWSETEEDLYTQAEYAKNFYTLVFSHPAVEALSWFDFTDHHWLGAPAGIVTDDLKIKPVYNTLYDLIHREWHSDADLVTGTNGLCKTRLFFGNYDITVDINGEKTTVNRDILRESFYSGGGEPERLVIEL